MRYGNMLKLNEEIQNILTKSEISPDLYYKLSTKLPNIFINYSNNMTLLLNEFTVKHNISGSNDSITDSIFEYNDIG